MNRCDVSIIIPAYNEAERIQSTLTETVSYLARRPWQSQILVIDDGSTDRTAALVRKFQPSHPVELQLIQLDKNHGKGAAVKCGVASSSGRLILFMDADMSIPISDLQTLQEKVEDGYDIAIGSKMQSHSKTKISQSSLRKIAGRIFNHTVRLMVGLPFHDTQCGFKLFTRNAADRIFTPLITTGFAFDVELLLRAKKQKLTVAEIPIHLQNKHHSTINPILDGLKMLRDVYRIRRFVQNENPTSLPQHRAELLYRFTPTELANKPA